MKMFGSKYTSCLALALLLVGCSRSELPETLSGGEKTPLQVEATLSSGIPVTKAGGSSFVENDVLVAYFRHTTGGSLGSYTTTAADQAPKLVTFTVDNAGQITPSEPLYWDDFSNSASADTDLRTSGHGLQSYYGYCYNGGTPSTILVDAAGTLGWTIGSQTTAEAFQHADLLWSREQETVTYAHTSAHNGAHGTITIPFTHAMSEITVTVIASDGFSGSSNPLASTVLILNGINTISAFTAPSAAFSSNTPTPPITMYGGTYTSGATTRIYTAIVAPGTELREGNKLLDIMGVDDNDYTLTITSSMLTTSNWASGHADGQYGSSGAPAKAYVITQPGVNYHLTVTVKKTEIQTHATLADWATVNATGEGDIVFTDNEDDDHLMMDDSEVTPNTNVQVVAVDKNKFSVGASFSLFTLQSASAYNDASARTNEVYTFATVPAFHDNTGDANDQWINNPKIYWPNKTNNYYFRALAKFNSVSEGVNHITSVGTFDTDKGTAVSQGTIAAGHDILWGTTAKHLGTSTNRTYERGQAIPPRTGGVPIAFEHAMSKLTMNLETTSDAAAVDLTGATISISNLYTSGTITIENGVITYTNADMTADAIAAAPAPISDLIVIPQTIGNDSKVTVTLSDGTTYKLQLNLCEDNNNVAVGQWVRGKHYVYTIHLEKEKITFRALVKDWDVVTGSGNANLEWD